MNCILMGNGMVPMNIHEKSGRTHQLYGINSIKGVSDEEKGLQIPILLKSLIGIELVLEQPLIHLAALI